MFRDLDGCSEDQFYDRILQAWQDAELNEDDADVLLSRLILDILDEDRQCEANSERTLMRILTNCLILVLALVNKKPVDLTGKNLFDLPTKQRDKLLRDLAAHIEE
ncbi:MAG TPA: hypothetical protein VKK79_04820 [Candidatus Lokiarchaeia archaeon]|nr:hypothetical protein [Candidatus Lokiarchaeia archaeon]